MSVILSPIRSPIRSPIFRPAAGPFADDYTAPFGLFITGLDIAEDASVGTAVGTLVTAGGQSPYTYTLTSDPSSLLAIDGDAVEVGASLTGQTTYAFSVRTTDARGNTFTEEFTLNVGAVSNDSGVGDGDGTVVDDGGFDDTPIEQDTNDGLQITGKNGGSAAFLFDIGAPEASGIYTMQYSADWTGMSRQGREAAVGFAFKDGNDFHLVSIRGDGANPADMLNSKVYGNFTQTNQFNVTNDDAATNGTKDGPNWIQLEIGSGGDTYTFRTSADGETWADEYTDDLPTPLANATDALEFGPGAYFTNKDKGAFQITISSWAVTGLSAPWAPTDAANLAVWYDARVGITGETIVSAWADQSGNGHAATQPSTGDRPAISTAAFGGETSILFSTGDHLENDGGMYSETLAVVFRPSEEITSSSNGQALISAEFNACVLALGSSTSAISNEVISAWGDAAAARDGISSSVISSIAAGSENILVIRENSGDSRHEIHFNGNGDQADLTNGTTTPWEVHTGTIGINGAALQYLGHIAEIVSYSVALSDTDLAKLEGYLAHKWGLEGNLPAEHTYKASAPETP